jgi:quinol-cytochrome oxidoreductase complex cytochrome b subunit
MEAKNWARQVGQWFEERAGVSGTVAALLHVDIPKNAQTLYLGGLAMFFFGVQATTGILLSLYYRGTPDEAYNSILQIMNEVRFGWLIRSVHAWSANLMIVAVVLHLLRVFVQAAYKRPREMTWMIGVLLLIATLGFGFTGYLLPWDQRAFWATTVGSEIAGSIPLIGGQLLELLRGGAEVTGTTLTRFLGVHMLVLPLTLAGLLVLHLFLVHRQGLAVPPNTPQEKQTEKMPFWPNYLLDELVAWYIGLAFLVVLASLFPAGLEPKANPLSTPAHIKPEWYFLSLYQALKLAPRTIILLLSFVGLSVVFFVPFIDRGPSRDPKQRLGWLIAAVVAVTVVAGMSVWGAVS